jgi:hypothetical protein
MKNSLRAKKFACGKSALGVVVVCNQSLEIYILQDKDMAAMLEENTLQIQSL